MDLFKSPQIVLFCKDVSRAADFYTRLGFEEVFRTPAGDSPIHVDLALDGYRIGLASEASTRDDHGLSPVATGQRAAVILWTDDTPSAYSRIQEIGAKAVQAPEPWLGRLLIAWVEDPDGHLIQIVQASDSAGT
jgi:catechol 2,3-dioxygenase-like lactoylglutathione lyase family enzyme